jgi:hypothetical protein
MIILDHIDAISRRQECDVLYLEFHPLGAVQGAVYRFEQDAGRDNLLHWLDMHHIAWQACGPIARVDRIEPYRGQVYVNVPYDNALPAYRLLRDALENPDGTMKHDWVRFMVMPLDYAMCNAAYDVCNFWENWAAMF